LQAADYFRRIPLFSDLSPEEIVDVLRIARLVSFEPGALLCARGEQGDCAFVIEEGEAAVRAVDEAGSPVVIARVGPGEVVGELSLVDGHPRSADVIATRALRGYRLDRAELDALRRAMHPAAFKILRRIAITVSDRLRDVNDAIGQALADAQKDPRRSRAGARASRELTRPSLPQAPASRPRAAAERPSRPRASTQAAQAPVRASAPGVARSSGASAARGTAPEPSSPGGGSLWGSMLAKLRGAPWK
jgi:CRP/FNR family cyclic AMP-dependent transcriptional regulator